MLLLIHAGKINYSLSESDIEMFERRSRNYTENYSRAENDFKEEKRFDQDGRGPHNFEKEKKNQQPPNGESWWEESWWKSWQEDFAHWQEDFAHWDNKPKTIYIYSEEKKVIDDFFETFRGLKDISNKIGFQKVDTYEKLFDTIRTGQWKHFYRSAALYLHPDKLRDNPQAEKVIKVLNTLNDIIEKSDNPLKNRIPKA